MLKGQRVRMVPFEMKYLDDYVKGFDAEITQYQWPDPFASVEDARSVLQEFVDEMDREEALLFSILSEQDEFLGSVEVHGLAGACPEVGVWIIRSEQNKGYAYEALSLALRYVRSRYGKQEFYYEADIRNTGSMKLLRKLGDQYELIEQGLERLTTDSGKELKLQGTILKAKEDARMM